MVYNEDPPLYSKDKEFIDELINEYITNVCIVVRSIDAITRLEEVEYSRETGDRASELYGFANDAELNMAQIEVFFKDIKIKY
jgi:hypothetical protein